MESKKEELATLPPASQHLLRSLHLAHGQPLPPELDRRRNRFGAVVWKAVGRDRRRADRG